VTIGSLFSGIGGLELGLERAGLGPVVWQVEIDPFCRRVLARHWPEADRSVTDVREAGNATLGYVDIMCGGFPCVDLSPAGGRAGLDGDTSGPLWFEFLRIVRELRPRFVVVENSAGLAARGLDVVIGGLSQSGYDAIWFPLSASDVGAPHGRERTFVVAHTDAIGCNSEPPSWVHAKGTSWDDVDRCCRFVPGPAREEWAGASVESSYPEPGLRRGHDGAFAGLDRRRLMALGNAVVPQCAEVVGWVIRGLM